MWIQKVFIFIVLCIESNRSSEVTSTRFGRSSDENSSDIAIVANDLAKLSRIINAIALQSAAARNTIVIREVITELLKANNESFSRIVRNDLKQDFNDFLDIDKKLVEISTNLQVDQNFFADISRINHILSNTKSSIEFIDDMKSELSTFFEFVSTANVHACDNGIVETVVAFDTLSNKKDKTVGVKMDVITDFKESISNLTACMDNIKQYKTVVRGEFETKYSIFAMLVVMRLNIDEIKAESDTLNRFEEYIVNVTKICNELGAAKEKWKASSVGAMLQRGINHLSKIAELKYAPPHSLTAGFSEIEDLKEVFDDLNSEWFRKKISKGKSTKKLENSLYGFNEFGKKMIELEKKWKEFQAEYLIARDHLNMTSVRLNVVENRSIIVDTTELNKTSTTFSECHKEHPFDGKEDFKEFDKEKKVFVKMHKLVGNISRWTEKTDSTFDPEILNLFLGEFQSYDVSGKSVETILAELTSLGGHNTFLSFIGMFQELKSLQSDIDTVFAMNQINTAQNSIETSFKRLKDSNYTLFLTCLNKNNLTLDEWEKAIEYIKPVLDRSHFAPTIKLFKKFLEMRDELVKVEKLLRDMGNTTRSISDGDPVLKLERSKEVSISFGRGVGMLLEMAEAYQKTGLLLEAENYHADIINIIQKKNPNDFVRRFWKNVSDPIEKLRKDLEKMNVVARKVKNYEFLEMKDIFLEAKTVEGFPEVFGHVYNQLKVLGYSDQKKVDNMNNAKNLSSLDLDFSAHKGYFPAASLSMGNIKTYFDDIFDLVGKKKRTENAFGLVFGVSFAIFIVIILIVAVGYGLTESGKERYRKLYLYYFPKSKEFEKRWRYSLFMDRDDGKNALLDGVREIHKEHVLKAAKRGVYINAYANFPPELGNTALHLATKRAYPEIVDILIRYGADRSLLNAQNKTPEQMIPSDYRETQKEKIARFEQVEKIYKKYGKKKFRIQVPDLFPVSSFHIYIEGKTDDDLTIAFTEKFQAICSEEVLTTTTHCVVKTDKDGMLETDDLKLLFWIFRGVIIVKDSWMTECLKNEDVIHQDADYLVEKVKFNEVVYDTVTQWTMAMAKGTMPFLYGVYVAVVIVGYEHIALLSSIVTLHGGVMLDKFPEKGEYNLGSRPYLHVNTSPLFIIHDGKVNLDHYKNDIDKMYSLFTEQEFLHFMLKRDIQVNQNPNPPPVAIDGMID